MGPYEHQQSETAYFAVHKETGKFYKGARQQVAFSQIGYLRSSISTNRGKEAKAEYDYYEINSVTLQITRVE